MGQFARHRHAWRVNEVSVARLSEGRKHDGTKLPGANHRGQDLRGAK
jgi:hypothetical protein